MTAPTPRPEPPYLRNPWKSYERNPYDGRYRVDEDKFVKVPCSETRIAFGSGGDCLKGYRLASGCDMVLDVVSYANENLAIEADTLALIPTNSRARVTYPANAMLIVIRAMIRKIFRT